MKAQYHTYLQAIRIYDICLKKFVLSETLDSYIGFFIFFLLFKDWVLETPLKIEFPAPKNGAWNWLDKTRPISESSLFHSLIMLGIKEVLNN